MSGFDSVSRGQRLQSALDELLAQVIEIEAAAVVSFDGLPMASALPETMNEDRVAAMSAALLSLGEKAAEGLGRGDLSQVFVEGQHGTVFLVACESEAVLVTVASTGAKTGLVLYEVRRTAASIAAILANDLAIEVQPSWEAPNPEVSADFVQALADAEAAYEAHRAESAVFQTMPYTSVVPDLNLVYTPHSAAAHGLSEPGQVSYLDPQIPVSSTDPVLSPPPQWALNVARDSDAS